ncbi:P4HA [Mytilus coruscus]|uniref:P4HA n=1 Tax=Mytilus coruscus TaxID=42192 RepID=A0A6J8DW67_MYTCO|nr:P4HA [Mytilus coruscus]
MISAYNDIDSDQKTYILLNSIQYLPVDKYEPHEDYPNEDYGDFSVVSRMINNSSNPENVGKEASSNVKVPSSKTKRAPMPLLSNLKRSDSTLSYGAKSVSIKTKRSNSKQFEAIKEDNSATRSDFPLHDGDINDAMSPFTRDNDSLSQLGAEDLYGVCASNKRTSSG